MGQPGASAKVNAGLSLADVPAGATLLTWTPMKHMFDRSIIDCIAQGRAPEPHELEAVAARLWEEGFGRDSGTDWAACPLKGETRAAAQAALTGTSRRQ
jgi:hypothetical protein